MTKQKYITKKLTKKRTIEVRNDVMGQFFVSGDKITKLNYIPAAKGPGSRTPYSKRKGSE